MQEFIEGKLGEVLAFARLGSDTLQKGAAALSEVFDEKMLAEAGEAFDTLAENITNIASEESAGEAVESAAEETLSKVSDMRDTYIDNKWNESSEVLEWMGFYTGAALVHWYLIAGASNALGLEKLLALSQEAIALYSNLFAADERLLADIGAAQSAS